jgi:hypothetical protein
VRGVSSMRGMGMATRARIHPNKTGSSVEGEQARTCSTPNAFERRHDSDGRRGHGYQRPATSCRAYKLGSTEAAPIFSLNELMNKAKKAKQRKPKATEERLIRENPSVAITKRAAATKRIAATVTDLRKEFAEVHDEGMVALEKHDFEAVKNALLRERKIIQTQKTLVEQTIRNKPKARR